MAAPTDRDILPDHVKPLNYHLSLTNLQFGGSWAYDGVVRIDGKVIKETDELVVNVKELQIKSAEVIGKGGSAAISTMTNVSYDEKDERATIKFSEKMSTGDVVVTIAFTGIMNDSMAGFYRAKYKPAVTPAEGTPQEGGFHYMFATQFESCDARRAFPCFDEPNLKASFELEIEIPDGLVAISNMPEKATTHGGHVGLKKVSFEKTPNMSTYLAAWAIGDFTYIEAHTERKYNGKNLPVRVYTTRGLEEQGRFALEHAHKTLDYFSDIFGIEYPLPKSDLLAVHEFAMGAMENWGLVTYRTTAVLYDEKNSDAKFRNRVAYVVAHELAHQWFGNLVTMDWWNELWLNEGFATWVGWLAVDHLHPEWNVWSQFVAEAVQEALQLDALRASHAIEVPVKSALDVGQIFDAISYLKGSSVIRMLSNHLGQEVFLKGVSDYLKIHAYGNARTQDLWAALSNASGQDVHAFMDPWIKKIGFPVVTIAEEPGQITILQERFLTTGDTKSEEDETTWWVPLGLRTGEPEKVIQGALTKKQDTIRDVDDGFYKLNADQSGFYRTNYPPPRLEKFAAAKDKLSVEDKIGLMGDATALAVSGNSTTPALLSLLAGFNGEDSFLVWQQIAASLSKARTAFSSNKAIAEGLKKFALKLVSPAAEMIGWEFKDHEEWLTGQLRKLLISLAAGAGHEGVIAEGKKRFQAWQAGDKTAVHQNLRSAIFNMVVANGGKAEYDAIKAEFLRTSSVDVKETCLVALGKTRQADLTQDLLEFVLTEDVALQDSHGGISSIAANNDTRLIAWDFTKSHWARIHSRMGTNPIVIDRWIRRGLVNFADHAIRDDILTFFKDKNTSGFDRSIVVVADSITANANYRQRDEAVLLEWLKTHGYA